MANISMRDSVVLRMCIVAGLGIMLLFPISIISQLVSERQETCSTALREVTEKWGVKQTITGPILTIPVKYTERVNDETSRVTVQFAHFLPNVLNVNTLITPEIRYRGIYRVALYNAQLSAEADFAALRFDGNLASQLEWVRKDASAHVEILWKEAFITFGITDLKGVRKITGAAADGQPLVAEPGLCTKDLVQTGFTFKMPLSENQNPGRLKLEMSVNGSEEIRVVPLGRETKVEMRSAWASPSFIGDFLPERREISGESFNATWNVLHWNRNLPQSWTGTQPHLQASSFGVKLLLPVGEYQKNIRAVKYAVMFIALTFLAFFVIDVLSGSPLHPIHYTLVGLALVLFFVLLLSVSEHLSFDIAYLIASVAVVLLITMYTRGVTDRWDMAAVVAGILIILYGLLFILLQLEDYALLLGSVSLFASLTSVMYLTRRIDWFRLGRAGRSAVVCPGDKPL